MSATLHSEPPRPVWPLAIAAALLSIVMRLLPYTVRLPNLAPVGAFSLYAGARLPLWAAVTMPLAVMGISDYFLYRIKGYPPHFEVYLCYFIATLIGMTLRRTNSIQKIGWAALAMNLMFFFVTNLFSWYELRGKPYDESLSGVVAALLAGIDFHQGTFFGDLLFVPLFFVAHAWIEKGAPAVEEVKV
jgi:hypothetical protein